MRGEGGGLRCFSLCVQLYTGAQINFGDLTPHLTYGWVGGSVAAHCMCEDVENNSQKLACHMRLSECVFQRHGQF
jgi:hypothetical protein